MTTEHIYSWMSVSALPIPLSWMWTKIFFICMFYIWNSQFVFACSLGANHKLQVQQESRAYLEQELQSKVGTLTKERDELLELSMQRGKLIQVSHLLYFSIIYAFYANFVLKAWSKIWHWFPLNIPLHDIIFSTQGGKSRLWCLISLL